MDADAFEDLRKQIVEWDSIVTNWIHSNATPPSNEDEYTNWFIDREVSLSRQICERLDDITEFLEKLAQIIAELKLNVIVKNLPEVPKFLSKLYSLPPILGSSRTCRAVLQCSIELASIDPKKREDQDEAHQRALSWAAKLIGSAFLGATQSSPDVENLPLACSLTVIDMMTDLGFNQMTLNIAVLEELVKLLNTLLDKMEQAHVTGKPLSWLPPEQELLVTLNPNHVVKEATVNIYQLSELIAPLVTTPSIFPLVQRLASWNGNTTDSTSSSLAPAFIHGILQNKETLYDKFSNHAKRNLWSKHNSIFITEMLGLLNNIPDRPYLTNEELNAMLAPIASACVYHPGLFSIANNLFKKMLIDTADSCVLYICHYFSQCFRKELKNFDSLSLFTYYPAFLKPLIKVLQQPPRMDLYYEVNSQRDALINQAAKSNLSWVPKISEDMWFLFVQFLEWYQEGVFLLVTQKKVSTSVMEYICWFSFPNDEDKQREFANVVASFVRQLSDELRKPAIQFKGYLTKNVAVIAEHPTVFFDILFIQLKQEKTSSFFIEEIINWLSASEKVTFPVYSAAQFAAQCTNQVAAEKIKQYLQSVNIKHADVN